MAAETLLQQLQEALAAEKLSKAEEVQAVEREMQARLESSAIRWRNELEQHEVFWSSELAAEQQRHEIIEAGLEAEVISLKFEAEDWKLKEGAEMACKDQAESSIVSLQLLCGEQKVQLHHLHAEAKAAADAENATSRLEMSLAEGERLRKEAFDLRVTLTALTDRCKRQEQALARLRNSSARSNLPRPPLAGRREGALRGLASSIGCKESMAQEACLKTVQEDDNHLQTWSMSEASLAPDAFAAAHNLQQETSGGFESPASSVLPDAFAAAHNLQQETSGGFESPASSVLPDGFAVARGDLFPRDPSIASLSEASSLLDPFTVVRGSHGLACRVSSQSKGHLL